MSACKLALFYSTLNYLFFFFKPTEVKPLETDQVWQEYIFNGFSHFIVKNSVISPWGRYITINMILK